MGGGKTYVALATLSLLHNLYPKTKSIIIRDSLPTLKKTTIPSFKKLLPSTLYQWNGTDYTATFANGSQMMFMSEDFDHDPDGNKFKGLEVNFSFLEQMEELRQETLEIVKIRTGRNIMPNMPKPLVMYTVNPSANWVKGYVWDRYKKGTLPDDHFYLPAYITDNPELSNNKEYMSQFENIDKLTYQRYIKGDWDAFAAKMPWAHSFSEIKHTGETEINIGEPIYISFDFNHSPVTCTLWQHYDDKIVCLMELGTNTGLVNLCELIKEAIGWNGELERQVFITGDMSGWARSALVEGNRTAYDIITSELNLTKYQVQAPKANPNLMKSRELVNAVLEKHTHFIIDRRCERLIFDLKFVEANDKHDIVKDRNKEAGKADYIDSMRYYLNTYHQNFVRL